MKKDNIKAVLDTNIFIASWFEESIECEKILELVKNRKIRLLFAQDTIGELIYLTKNFARHNIDDVYERILLLKGIAELFYHSLSINTMKTEIENSNDEYDDMFLKCAIEGKADYLITDDIKHGLHEREYNHLKIYTSEDFIKQYEEEHGEINITQSS
jgi:putative PIN family toxin of toxin-antitoxin system